jgi:hypothetical protein
MCGLFNLELAFSIFFKTPARLFFHELGVTLPCSVEAFTAKTSAGCYQALLRDIKDQNGYLVLSDIMSAFSKNSTYLYEGTLLVDPWALLFTLFGMLFFFFFSNLKPLLIDIYG